MEYKKMVAGVITISVMIIVVATVMMPVISDAQNNAEPITKINEGTGRTFKEMAPGDVLKCVSNYSSDGGRDDTWTINNKTVLNEGITDVSWDWGLVSDGYFLSVADRFNPSIASGQVIQAEPGSDIYYPAPSTTYPALTYTWVMNEDKSITVSRYNGAELASENTYAATWAYVLSSVEDGAFMSAHLTANTYYANYGDMDIILAGNYTTGDFDTGYYYGKNGVLTVVNSEYTGTITFTQSLTDGTTDIYDTTIEVILSDGDGSESFNPYRALVPYEVKGHADNGALFNLYGTIPAIVLVGVLVAAVGIFLRSRSQTR